MWPPIHFSRISSKPWGIMVYRICKRNFSDMWNAVRESYLMPVSFWCHLKYSKSMTNCTSVDIRIENEKCTINDLLFVENPSCIETPRDSVRSGPNSNAEIRSIFPSAFSASKNQTNRFAVYPGPCRGRKVSNICTDVTRVVYRRYLREYLYRMLCNQMYVQPYMYDKL